jgi:thiopurine S-methyltransferase
VSGERGSPDLHGAWHERWREGRIGFHIGRPHDALLRHAGCFLPPPGGSVFVPLAGKAHDLVWLRDQQRQVVAVELSPLAVQAFHEEHGIRAVVREHPRFRVHESPGIRFFEGDVFDLRAADVGPLAAVFDRAALIALPREERARYVPHVRSLLAPGARTLLVSLSTDPADLDGPPYPVGGEEIAALYGAHASIRLLEASDAMDDRFREKGAHRVREEVWLLEPRAVSARGPLPGS